MKWGYSMILSEKALKVKPSATLSITAKANKMKSKGIDIIDFGAGESDFDTPEHIKQAAIDAINDNFTKNTPNAGIKELREAICKKFKKENNLEYNYHQIVVSNGSKQALFNAVTAILNPGDEVIIPAPYWLSYPEVVKLCNGIPIIINTEKEDCFKVRIEQLESALTNKTKAIIINTPCNPTGMVYTINELEKIAEFAVKNDLFIISDEVYEKLIYSSKMNHVSIASLNKEIYERTIIINSFSKSHAMTGWRVGYTASSLKVADIIKTVQGHFSSNINSVSQKAALAALTGEQTYIEDMVKEFKHRRDYIYQRVSDIPLLSSLTPKGAFYLFVDISKLCGQKILGVNIKDGDDVAEILLNKYNVAVIPCTVFGYDKYIRLSYAISMENIVNGIDRIEKFVKENY